MATMLIVSSLGEDTPEIFAGATSCELQQHRDVLEYAHHSDGISKAYMPGRCGWRVSCECLLSDDMSAVESAFRAGAPVLVSCRARYTARQYKGLALITSLRAAGRIREMATYTIQMTGTGPLDYTEFDAGVSSCFGGGAWQSSLPWLAEDGWKSM